MMMMRRIMILFVLVCVMSLTMAHPQQSLSPTQSLRRDVRFVQTKSFKDTLTTWAGSAKKKYCAVRAVVEKGQKKHPMAFFVAKTGLKIGGKVLVGIATAGVSEVALEAAALIGAAYTAGKDYANDLKNIKASTLTTSARLACATRSTATNLGAFIVNGIVAIVEVETGVDLQAVIDSAPGFVEGFNAVRAEMGEVVSDLASGLPGMQAVANTLGETFQDASMATAQSNAEKAIDKYLGFSCQNLCMLDQNVDAALQAAAGLAPGQNYCAVPGTIVVGRFRCPDTQRQQPADGGRARSNAIQCELIEGLEGAGDDTIAAGVRGWLKVSAESAIETAADYATANV